MNILTEQTVTIEHEDGKFIFTEPNAKQLIQLAEAQKAKDNQAEKIMCVFDMLVSVENVRINGEEVDVAKFKSYLDRIPSKHFFPIGNKAVIEMMGLAEKKD